MPRLTLRQGTIYNGMTYNQRFTTIKPPLGAGSISRSDMIADELNRYNKGVGTKNGDGIAARYIENKREESLMKLDSISLRHTDILFQAKTVFPLDLFPDILTITATKIELMVQSFFYSYNTVTIPLQDIGHIELEKSPFFSTLNIINIRADKPITISNLWNWDAIRGKKIINGLLIAQEAGVDISVIEPKKLLGQLERLGT